MTQINSKADWKARTLSLFPDNTTGEISAEDLRDMLEDTYDTFPAISSVQATNVELRFNTKNTNTIQLRKRSGSGAWTDAGSLDIGTIQKFNTLVSSSSLTRSGNVIEFAATRGGVTDRNPIDISKIPHWDLYYTKTEADNTFAQSGSVHSIEDLIYSPGFRTQFATLIGRFNNDNDSTFFVDQQFDWAYPEPQNPTDPPDLINDFRSIDFSQFYGKWITTKANISSPDHTLRVYPKTGVTAQEVHTFILLEVRNHPIELHMDMPGSSNPFAHSTVTLNLSVGWHSLLFLRQADGRTRVDHKPFIDKMVLDKWTERNSRPSLEESRLQEGVFGVDLKDSAGTTLASPNEHLIT